MEVVHTVLDLLPREASVCVSVTIFDGELLGLFKGVSYKIFVLPFQTKSSYSPHEAMGIATRARAAIILIIVATEGLREGLRCEGRQPGLYSLNFSFHVYAMHVNGS